MRGSRVVLGAAVLTVLLVGTLLAYTGVGQEVGLHWNEPAEVAALQSDQDTFVSAMAATGDREGGAVAWIERDGDDQTVRVARFNVRKGTVEVGERQTVARPTPRLTGLDVAVRGREVAVAWSRPVENQVVLARVTEEGINRRVIADPFRVGGPTVTLTPRGPAVAYTAADAAGTPFEVRTARVTGGNVTVARVGGPSRRAHAPTVTSAGNRLAVIWFNSGNDTATVTTGGVGSASAFDRTVVAGEARVKGAFSGGTREVPFVAGARTASAVRPVWTDAGTVTATTVDDRGTVGEPQEFGPGGHPDAAARGDRWLLAWVAPRRGTGDDVFFRSSRGTGDVVSQFTSNAIWPRPAFAPAPAIAWVEWGSTDRVLVSAYLDDRRRPVLARLTNAPQRFAFISLSAAVLGLVTVPIMPWSFLGLFGAFVATTGVVTSRALRAGAWLLARLGREMNAFELRRRLGEAPAAIWTVLFALVETPLVVYLIASIPQLREFGFAHPVGASAGALLAALAVVVVTRIESNWGAVITFVCFQNAAMWAIAATTFL